MSPPALAEALARADLIHPRAALDAAIARVAGEMRRDLSSLAPLPLFITVMNGGLVFAGALALELGFDVAFDYCHATRYRGATSGSELHWIARPRSSLAGQHVLLIDDILDEGYTLQAVRDWCRGEGATSVRIAVLCRKRHDRAVAGLVADYIGVDVPDRYVFGFGMDYHEQGRNLPGIYAL